MSDLDEVYLIGDFNARTADLKDYIEGVDDMKPRYNADKIRNNQGIELIKFLKDTRMHIVNGRINGNNGLCTKYDAHDSEIPSGDYTFYSRSGGTSAIDYVISSPSGLEKINMHIIHPWKTVRAAGAHLIISEQFSIPDHAIIVTDVAISNIQEKNYDTKSHKKEYEGKIDERRRYNVKSIPRHFMHNQEWQAVVLDLINIMEQNIAGKSEIDDVYTKYVNHVKAEMNKFLPIINKKSRRKFKHCKPFWDMDLAEQWEEMHTAFIRFSKSDKRNIPLRTRLKSVYRLYQCEFDKMLRRKEHSFNK